MPLLRQCSPFADSLAAVWQIDEATENELYFSNWRARVAGDPDITGLPKLPRRRLEFLAGRYLLWQLENSFPIHQIQKDEFGKPRLPEDQFHFSISHSFPWVAVLISPNKCCGIDIQRWHPRIQKLAPKFLGDQEMKLFAHDDQWLTMAWSIKEAAYKWAGKRGIDFIRDLKIESIIENNGSFLSPVQLPPHIAISPLYINSFLEDGFSLSLVCE